MPTRTLTVPASAIRAALAVAPKKDLRQYLNAVYFDFPAGRIVATDGAVLFAGQIPAHDCPPVIVPRDALDAALKLAGKRCVEIDLQIAATEGHAARTVTIRTGQADIPTLARDDHHYPDYMRVIPRAPSGAPAQFNPELLVTARNALCAYLDRPAAQFTLETNGDHAARMCAQHALTVIMPMRADSLHVGSDDWLDGTPAETPAETPPKQLRTNPMTMTVSETQRICADCLAAIANGDKPDDPVTAARIYRAIASVAAENGAWVAGGEDGNDEGFSWSPCDCCGSPDGGMRYTAHILTTTPSTREGI